MRHASRVVVGSPTTRIAALAAATLLVTILGAAALVAGAQSTSPAPPADAAVSPPVEFTGQVYCGPEVRAGTTERHSWDDERTWTQSRGDAWRQAVIVSDPRLEGEIHQSIDSSTYHRPGSDGIERRTISWSTHRIENDEGAWQGSAVSFDLPGEPDAYTTGDRQTYVLIGEGAYEGLTAIYDLVMNPDYRPCGADVYGLIFEGHPSTPEPFIPPQ